MKILKDYYTFLNEELKHLPPPTDKETEEGLKEYDALKRLELCIKNNLDKKYYPSQEEIFNEFKSMKLHDVMVNSIKLNYLNGVKYALNHGYDVDGEKIKKIDNPLIYAIWSKKPEIASYLIEKGANVNCFALEKPYYTPLQIASKNGYIDIVEKLLKNGADINIKNIDRLNALSYAIDYNHLDVVKLLINNGSIIDNSRDAYGYTILDLARYKPEIKNYLLSINNSLTEELKHLPPPSDDETIKELKKLSSHDIFYSCIKYNLSLKFFKLANKKGLTADDMLLLSVLKYQSLYGVEKSIELGADVNTTDSDDWSVLMCSSRNGNLDIVKYLVEHGADVNKIDKWTDTALMCASEKGHLPVVEYLVEHGADVNIQNNIWKRTALICASEKGHLSIVKYLVEHGADVNLKGKFGQTAYEYAKQEYKKDIMEYLSSLKNNLNEELRILKGPIG